MDLRYRSVVVLLAASFAGVLAPGAGHASPALFKCEARVYPTETGTILGVAVADLDRDGTADLVALNRDIAYHYFADLLTIRMGTASGLSGSFTTPYGGQSSSQDQFVIADVDGDGWPDVVIATDFAVKILRNHGDGTLEAYVDIPHVGDEDGPVAVADVNGDGRADILYAATHKNVVHVMLGAGSLTFTPGPTIPTRVGPTLLGTADFDGNHVPDILVGAKDTSTVVFDFPDGSMAAHDFLAGGAFVAGDLDHNGAPDIVSRTNVHLNRGDGVFVTPYPHGVDTPVETADVDGDDNLDILGMPAQDIGRSQALLVARGVGNGTFMAPMASPRPDSAPQLAVGDFDHDGIPDVAIARSNWSGVWILQGVGQGRFEQSRFFGLPETPDIVARAHLNDDALPDIVTMGGTTIRVLHSTGSGNFVLAGSATAPGPMAHLLCADVDGDGRDDIIVQGSGTTGLSIWLTRPDGTPGPRIDTPTVSELVSIATILTADVNHDGFADVFVTGTITGSVPVSYFLRGNGDGTFIASEQLPRVYLPTFVDMDGDGYLDVVGSQAGNLYLSYRVFQGIPPGTYSGLNVRDSAVPGYFDAVARVDDDIYPDIVSHYYSCPGIGSCQKLVSWLKNRGDGTTEAPTSLSRGWLGATEDLDGDGHRDQMGAAGPEFYMARGLGDGTFEAVQNFGAAGATDTGGFVGDLNGDGFPDVCLGASGGLLMIMNQSMGAVSVGPDPHGDPRPRASLSVQAWPNPARFDAGLRLSIPKAGWVSVEVFGIDGRRAAARTFQATAGPLMLPLRGSDELRPGVYLARVRQGGAEAVTRFCVMR